MRRRASLHNLGCKVNAYETEAMEQLLAAAGYEIVPFGETSDVCIINTCSVTEHADKKCRNVVRKAIRENPGALVAVTGCYAQLRPGDLAAIEGVDIVVGNNEKGSLYEQVVAMLQSGLKLTDIAVREYVADETARVSQSLQQMNAEL